MIVTPTRSGQVKVKANLSRTTTTDKGVVIVEPVANLNLEQFYARRDPLRRNKKVNDWRPMSPYYSVIVHRRAILEDYVEFIGNRSTGINQNVSYQGDPGSGNIYSQINYGKYFNSAYGLLSPNPNIRFRAETEALLKLADMQANLGEMMAEMKKSVNMVSSSFRDLILAYSAARKGNWKGVLKALGGRTRTHKWNAPAAAISARWLELQYGWTPLVLDIYGGYTAFREGYQKNRTLLSVVRECSHYLKAEDICTRTAIPSALQPYNFARASGKESYKVKLYYEVDDAFWLKMNQIGLVNPLQVAWAVVPFSFMVDWILPVESFLLACTAPVGLTFVDGCITHRLQCLVDEEFVPPLPYGTTQVNGRFHRLTDIVAVQRERYSRWPTPKPFYKNPFSTSHVRNALAVAHQVLSRRA